MRFHYFPRNVPFFYEISHRHFKSRLKMLVITGTGFCMNFSSTVICPTATQVTAKEIPLFL